jgi:hypothetical protein
MSKFKVQMKFKIQMSKSFDIWSFDIPLTFEIWHLKFRDDERQKTV